MQNIREKIKPTLNKILSILLLLGIAFSVIKIVQSAALNPGHAWNTLDDASLPVANGGTGLSTFGGTNTVLYTSAANTLTNVAVSTAAGQFLQTTAAGGAPTWATILGVANGGTGAAPGAAGDQVLVSDSTSAATWRLVNDCQGAGKALTYTQSTNAWGCNTISGGSNALLDGSSHTDTTAGTVARGDIITGQTATPKWTKLAKGTANQVLSMDGTATDVVWATPAGGSSYRTLVTLGSDVINNNATLNTLQDCTGLSFAVVSGTRYRFHALIWYTSAVATTGSRWTLNGPTFTNLAYRSQYLLTATTHTFNNAVAYSIPAASNATSLTAGNIAIIEGTILPSANGTVVVRFASEVASSAITCKAGSTLEWW